MADERELRFLVERARRHDPDAWEALYRHAHDRLHAYARRRLWSDVAADDAVSETMTRALAGIGGFSWRGAGVDGWLYGIIRNVVLETQRRSGRMASEPVPADLVSGDDGPLDSVVRDETAASVRAAFSRLSPSDQEVLELRVVGELDAAAVGEVVGKAPGAIRMAQSRALLRLRDLLQEGARSER